MTRTRSERRHHTWRMKQNRKNYHTAGAHTPAHIGKAARTPCLCSCWMCGNQRERFGQSIRERRNRALCSDVDV